jgi:hypothetical protein
MANQTLLTASAGVKRRSPDKTTRFLKRAGMAIKTGAGYALRAAIYVQFLVVLIICAVFALLFECLFLFIPRPSTEL